MSRPGSPEFEDARAKSPSEKLMETLDLARTGFQLKRVQLRTRYPLATEAELADHFARWLEGDDDTRR